MTTQIEKVFEMMEIQLFNELLVPVLLNLKYDRPQQKGLFELYCCDNDRFIDLLMTFGSPHCIQKVVFGISQGKYSSELFSDEYFMKIFSLIFENNELKPYIYQQHLWQLINAISR